MSKRLVVMCGIPGSGKSTYVESHKADYGENYKTVSRDKIRFSLLKEGEDYFSHEDETWSIFIKEIREGLKKNKTVFVDATHLNPSSRRKLFYGIGKDFLKGTEIVGVSFEDTPEDAIKRNENRLGTRSYVPPTVIRNMYKSFVPPRLFVENFDEILHIKNGVIDKRERTV